MTRSAKQRIDGMCKLYHIDIEGAYKQGKFILETYRDLSWKTAREANYVREDLMSYCSADMDQALVYLLTFATDERRDFFESKIDALFTSHTMGGMIESAAAWVRDYPAEGNLYYNIIYLRYLCRDRLKESELLEVLDMERSTYYKRRKEAVTVFGVAIHEMIRRRKVELEANRREAMLHPMDAVS